MTIKPDRSTLMTLFNACAQFVNDRSIKLGKKLVEQMPDNCRDDIILLTSSLHMLMKFGDIQSAEKIFKMIKSKDIVTYGAMMKGNLL
jgi:hypothetical protein